MNEDVKNEGPKINRLHRSLIGHIGEINDVVFAPNPDNSTWSLSYLKLLARRRSKIYKSNKCNDMFNIYFTR